jgi:hypothetical protein
MLGTAATAAVGTACGEPAIEVELAGKVWVRIPGSVPAALASAVVTAKLNDINPQAWVADVLPRTADHPASGLDDLLPWHWKVTQDQAAGT